MDATRKKKKTRSFIVPPTLEVVVLHPETYEQFVSPQVFKDIKSITSCGNAEVDLLGLLSCPFTSSLPRKRKQSPGLFFSLSTFSTTSLDLSSEDEMQIPTSKKEKKYIYLIKYYLNVTLFQLPALQIHFSWTSL